MYIFLLFLFLALISFSIYVYINHSKGIIISMYHSIGIPGRNATFKDLFVTPINFERQMNYLSRHRYKIVSIKELERYIKADLKLQKRMVAITFDDGYKNNYINAFPILKKYGFTATVFIPPGKIGKKSDWIEGLDNQEDLMSWEEIKQMSNFGISFQSHTYTHAHLLKVTTEEAKEELAISKQVLEERLGKDIYFVCYPYGSYNQKIKEIAKAVGYLGAISMHRGINNLRTDPLALKRIKIEYKDSLFKFALKLKFCFVFNILREIKLKVEHKHA